MLSKSHCLRWLRFFSWEIRDFLWLTVLFSISFFLKVVFYFKLTYLLVEFAHLLLRVFLLGTLAFEGTLGIIQKLSFPLADLVRVQLETDGQLGEGLSFL